MLLRSIVLLCSLPVLWYPANTAAEVGPLSRQVAVQVALDANPEVVAAEMEREAADARIRQASALPDPEFELEFEELSDPTGLGDFGERSFGLTQTIEFPLKWSRRRLGARQEAEAVRQSVLETTRHDVTLRVRSSYDRVLLEQRRLDFHHENLKLFRSLVEKAESRRAAGDAPPLDVMRAEVETSRAINRLTQVRNDLAAARSVLNTLLGRDTRSSLQLTDDLLFRPVSHRVEDLQAAAMERRPELVGSDWALARARTEQAVAGLAFVPDLSVGVFRQTVDAPGGAEKFWRVGFAVELPLWAAARQRGERAEAKAWARRADAERNRIRAQTRLEVELAHLMLTNAGEQVRQFEDKIIGAAERTLEIASRSYQEGKATYLELLEAQRALIEVREEQAVALFNYRIALAELERAVGGDLGDLPE